MPLGTPPQLISKLSRHSPPNGKPAINTTALSVRLKVNHHNASFLAPISFVGTSLLVPVILVIRFTLNTLRPADFPPGPPIIPDLGNAPQLPFSKPFIQFDKWSKIHGSILGLKATRGHYFHCRDRRNTIYLTVPSCFRVL